MIELALIIKEVRLTLISLVLIRGIGDADQQNPEPAENSARLLLVPLPPPPIHN